LNQQLLLRNEDSILNKKEALKSLIEHAKYLYEEEVRRGERFHNAVKTYLVFMLSTFTVNLGAIKLTNISSLGFSHILPVRDLVIGGFFGVSIIATAVSFVLLILVIKTWRTERICGTPREFYSTLVNATDEASIFQGILRDFLVAAEKNARVNDKKGKLLFLAARTYYSGVFFLAIGGTLYVYAK